MDITTCELGEADSPRFGSKSSEEPEHFPRPLEQASLTDTNHLLLQLKPKIGREQRLRVSGVASALRSIEKLEAGSRGRSSPT